MKKILVSVCAAMLIVCLAMPLTACVNFTSYETHSHIYGEWTVTKTPTETNNGKATRTCSLCEVSDAGHKIAISLPPLTSELYKVTYLGETDCEHGGDAEYTLAYEGEAIVFTAQAPAKGHDYGDWIDEVPATYEDYGVKGHYACADCGKLFDADYNETTEADLVIDKLVAYEADANAYYLVGQMNGLKSWTPYSDDYKLETNEGNLGAKFCVYLKEGDEIKVYKNGAYYSCVPTEGVNTVVAEGEGSGNGVILADGYYDVYLNLQGVVYIAFAQGVWQAY